MKTVRLILWGLVVIAAGFYGYTLYTTPSNTPAPQAAQTIMRQDYALVTHTNIPTTKADLMGHPSIVFFGFTNCPDICPAAMFEVSELLKNVPQNSPLKSYLVTVDPDRDSPEALATFIQSFDPRIIGLTGDLANLEKIKKDFHVYAKKVEIKEDKAAQAPSEYPAPATEAKPADPHAGHKHAHHSKSNYTLEHTSTIFLLNEKGELVGTLSPAESMDVKNKKVQRLIGKAS